MKNTSYFDEQMYSRQIVLLGLETMEKISKLSILIIGQRGLGIEIAKNIIVSGPLKVSIFDHNLVEISDLGSNFYLKEEDIGKRRDLASLNSLVELNEYVKVDYIKKNCIKEIYNDIINNFNVVVVTEILPLDESKEINNICRNNNIKFIYSAICGLASFVFDDFGDEHIIFDKYCEKANKFKIKNIKKTSDGSGLLEIQLEKERENLLIGDSVIFKEVEGMTEINYENCQKIWEIKKKPDSNNIFIIDNISNFSDYTFGGYIEERPIPKKMKYFSFSKKLEIPFTQEEDEFLNWKQKLIFIIFKSLMIFKTEKKILPKKGNKEQLNEIIKLVDKELQFYKCNKKENMFNNIKLDETIIKNICETARAEICCMTSLIGGIVCQEIIKTTGKYIPINQWEIFNFLEYSDIIPNEEKYAINIENRYSEYEIIFGKKIMEKIQSLNIFLAGAGALGCELLKNMSLLGIGTNNNSSNSNGSVLIIDDDMVELSNLNRQFLFHKKDIGKYKTFIAKESADKINKDLKCKALCSRISEDNFHLFYNFDEYDLVLSAIDSNDGNYYLSELCQIYEKILIKGGIKGPQGKVETFIPKITCSLNDIDYHQMPVEKVPQCTRRRFPKKIEECIDNARDLFEEFNRIPFIYLKEIINKNIFHIENDILRESLEKHLLVYNYLKILINKNDYNNYFSVGLFFFQYLFDYKINILLNQFPLDLLDENSTTPFWKNKIPPTELKFDIDDELSFNFVFSFLKIINNSLKLNFDFNENYMKAKIKEILDNKNNSYENKIKELNPDILLEKLNILLEKIKNNTNLINDIKNIIVPEFEKDKPELYHVSFIHNYANLEAKSYKIPMCDKFYSFEYVGKIGPTIITSIATISGFMCLQIFGLFANMMFIENSEINQNYLPKEEKKESLEDDEELKENGLHNLVFNLGSNDFFFSEFYEPKYIELGLKVKDLPEKYTNWDKIIIQGGKTIKELNSLLKERYSLIPSLIYFIDSDYHIYETKIKKTDLKEKIKNLRNQNKNEDKNEIQKGTDKKIEDIYLGILKNKTNKNINNKFKYIFIKVKGKISDTSVKLPVIKYIIQ